MCKSYYSRVPSVVCIIAVYKCPAVIGQLPVSCALIGPVEVGGSAGLLLAGDSSSGHTTYAVDYKYTHSTATQCREGAHLTQMKWIE